MVLHKPLEELVNGFGGKEGHGISLLSVEIKKEQNLIYQIPLFFAGGYVMDIPGL